MPEDPASTTLFSRRTGSWPVVSRSAVRERSRTALTSLIRSSPASARSCASSAIASSTVTIVPSTGATIASRARDAASSSAAANAGESGTSTPTSASATPRSATERMRPELPRAPRWAPVAIASMTSGSVTAPFERFDGAVGGAHRVIEVRARVPVRDREHVDRVDAAALAPQAVDGALRPAGGEASIDADVCPRVTPGPVPPAHSSLHTTEMSEAAVRVRTDESRVRQRDSVHAHSW